jgi:hypothetical protein
MRVGVLATDDPELRHANALFLLLLRRHCKTSSTEISPVPIDPPE